MSRRDLTSDTAQDHFDVEAVARRRGVEPYQVRAAGAVGDRLMAEIVSDFRRPLSQSSSMIPPSHEPAKPKGTGWQDAAPLKPVDTRYIDAQCDAQDRADRAAAFRQRIETDWIESHFEKGPRIESEYDPLDNARLKK